MNKLAIIYHSAQGHTEHIARQILVGTREVEDVAGTLIKAEEMVATPDELIQYDGFIFGSPTYQEVSQARSRASWTPRAVCGRPRN